MCKLAAGYTRLSQDRISIENQKASIRNYCRKHEFDLTTIYNDGRHARATPSMSTPSTKRSVNMFTIETWQPIIFRDIDRLGQDFDERMLFIIDLRKPGIDLHTVERGQRDHIPLLIDF